MLPSYISYLSLFFGLLGIFMYLRDTIGGHTKPNLITWIFWAIAPLVAVYINYKSGVSVPLLVSTFVAGFGPLLVVIVSLFNKHAYWKISLFDCLCGIFSALAIVIWVSTKNSIVSLSFAIIADFAAGLPTIIKAWKHSDTESHGPYSLGILNQFITFSIMTTVTYESIAFPLYFILANSVIVAGIYHKKIQLFFK